MKKRLVMLMFIILASYLYSVDIKYIPDNSKIVLSLSLDNISKKANFNTQELLNNIVLGKIASNFAEYRDDNRVIETMTNGVLSLLNFSNTSRIAIFTDYSSFAMMFDVLSLSNVDMTMIRIANQENRQISVSEYGYYRYLSLDENTLLAWNDEIFTVILKNNNYYTDGYEEDYSKESSITTIADSIFKKDMPLTNSTFVNLEKDKSDISAWVDMSYLNERLSSLILGLGYNNDSGLLSGLYSNSSMTAKLNFYNGEVDLVLDTYTPNSYDQMSLKKELDKKIYRFVPSENNLGFLSLAFRSDALVNVLKGFIGESDIENNLNEELSSQNIGINNIYDLLSLLGGDIFASVWSKGEYDSSYLISFTVSDKDKVKEILTNFMANDYELSEKNGGMLYSIGYDSLYMKDNIIYIGDANSIDNVVNEKPVKGLENTKIDLALKNMFVLYIDFDIISKYDQTIKVNDFKSLYVTSNPVDKTHSEVRFKLELKNKNKNSLEVLYSLFKDKL